MSLFQKWMSICGWWFCDLKPILCAIENGASMRLMLFLRRKIEPEIT
jgi:hypothetical protein